MVAELVSLQGTGIGRADCQVHRSVMPWTRSLCRVAWLSEHSLLGTVLTDAAAAAALPPLCCWKGAPVDRLA